jgi:lysophospholipid acyltransferase 5
MEVRADALRLVLVLCSTYFFACVETLFLHRARFYRPLYHMIVSSLLAYICFGSDAIHCLLTASINYVILYMSSLSWYSRRIALVFSFIFTFVYLLVAYRRHRSLEYSVDFTIPQCILTLKLMGLAFDYHDGQKKELKEQLAGDDEFHARPLRTLPSLLDYMGFVSFYPAFFAGPVYSYEEYQTMLAIDLKHTPSRGWTVVSLVLSAWLYLSITFLTETYLPRQRLIDDTFIHNHSFFTRCMYFWLSYRFSITKYLGVWLLVEGASVVAGAGYSHLGHHWRGWRNVRPLKLELARDIRGVVASFNIRTNAWAKYYIFKRLKWLYSKHLSMIVTLAFLALWHGFWPGYFISFAYEFICLLAEQQLRIYMDEKSSSRLKLILHQNYLCVFLIWCFRGFIFDYGMIAFELLTWPSIYKAYRSLGFIGHVIPIGWILLSLLCLKKRQQPS